MGAFQYRSLAVIDRSRRRVVSRVRSFGGGLAFSALVLGSVVGDVLHWQLRDGLQRRRFVRFQQGVGLGFRGVPMS